jgi:hypothetical protein
LTSTRKKTRSRK